MIFRFIYPDLSASQTSTTVPSARLLHVNFKKNPHIGLGFRRVDVGRGQMPVLFCHNPMVVILSALICWRAAYGRTGPAASRAYWTASGTGSGRPAAPVASPVC